jgi:deazaflavin-dependent oxidoreductase (nitroreductase family)
MDARFPKSMVRFNGVFKFLNRVGVHTGPIDVLTVTGRHSGRARSTPVTPAIVDGHEYLVAPLPTVDWARNVRATGSGTLARGRHATHVRFAEVTDPALKQRVSVAYAHVVPQAAQLLTAVGAAPEKTDAGYAAAGSKIAVFEVTPEE